MSKVVEENNRKATFEVAETGRAKSFTISPKERKGSCMFTGSQDADLFPLFPFKPAHGNHFFSSINYWSPNLRKLFPFFFYLLLLKNFINYEKGERSYERKFISIISHPGNGVHLSIAGFIVCRAAYPVRRKDRRRPGSGL
jgi:hypothetical protein